MIYVLIGAGAAWAVWNIIVFGMYATDKKRAANKQWRIKESTLILCAFVMGGLGAILGMYVLRHKTQHWQFKILVPIALVLNIAILVVGVYFSGVLPF
ncbi:MAG: DUF1294 domain-containing protein [Defluviitaleaceae bacterium]|nr:DUF1294 domain-containing protein [Defluviitaleaceae bacterium]